MKHLFYAFAFIILAQSGFAQTKVQKEVISISKCKQKADDFLKAEFGELFETNIKNITPKSYREELVFSSNKYLFGYTFSVPKWNKLKKLHIEVDSLTGQITNHKECVYCVDYEKILNQQEITKIALENKIEMNSFYFDVVLGKSPRVVLTNITEREDISIENKTIFNLYSGEILSSEEISNKEIPVEEVEINLD